MEKADIKGVAVVVRRGTHILMGRRKHDGNQLALPGGKIEPDEVGSIGILQAALRELKEETGLDGLNPEILFGGCRPRRWRDNDNLIHEDCAVLVQIFDHATPVAVEPDKTDLWEWVDIESVSYNNTWWPSLDLIKDNKSSLLGKSLPIGHTVIDPEVLKYICQLHPTDFDVREMSIGGYLFDVREDLFAPEATREYNNALTAFLKTAHPHHRSVFKELVYGWYKTKQGANYHQLRNFDTPAAKTLEALSWAYVPYSRHMHAEIVFGEIGEKLSPTDYTTLRNLDFIEASYLDLLRLLLRTSNFDIINAWSKREVL